MSTKVYCGNAREVETKFGKITKLSFTEEDLKKMQAALDGGWVNVAVMERREPSKGGMTHYCQIDTWKPSEPAEMSKDEAMKIQGTADRQAHDDNPYSEPLPF